MLRFTSIQWNKSMESEAKFCSSCSKPVRSRFECTVCSKSLCDICCEIFATNNAWFDEHKDEFPNHKSFRSIVPPNFSMPLELERNCRCVEDPDVIMHCSRCLSGKVFDAYLYSQKLTVTSTQTWQHNLLVHHLQKHLRFIDQIMQKVLPRRALKA